MHGSERWIQQLHGHRLKNNISHCCPSAPHGIGAVVAFRRGAGLMWGTLFLWGAGKRDTSRKTTNNKIKSAVSWLLTWANCQLFRVYNPSSRQEMTTNRAINIKSNSTSTDIDTSNNQSIIIVIGVQQTTIAKKQPSINGNVKNRIPQTASGGTPNNRWHTAQY